MIDGNTEPATSSNDGWREEIEPEVTNTPTPYDHRYRALGGGCYIRRPCPHDE